MTHDNVMYLPTDFLRLFNYIQHALKFKSIRLLSRKFQNILKQFYS